MPILTPKQIATVASNAGWTGRELQVAVAVAMAESSGNSDVVNHLGCVGLWQIYQSVHVGSHPTWTTPWLKIPQNNANAAKTLYDAAGGWGPWSAHTNGAYKQYMDTAAAAVANRSSGDIPPGTTTGGSSVVTGPKKGAIYDPASVYLKNAPTMKDFRLMGSKLEGNAKNSVISARVSYTTDMVSQVEITILDPDFEFLETGLGKVGTPASLQSMKLVVATCQTSMISGTPAVTLKCRPEIVHKLKRRRGAKVMSNVSPSQFVKAESEAVGAGVYIQASPVRSSVARDLPEDGEIYEKGQEPSSWTTFQRLASELGFICFEENNTIYFGQPTYFTRKGKKQPLEVNYNTGPSSKRSMNIPECSKSADSKEVTVSTRIPLSRAAEARCGRTLKLDGVPTFNGHYLIKSVNYNLVGQTEFLTVDSGTPIDPVAQPPEGEFPTSLYDVGSSSDGSWPLPSQFKVTTPWGVRGGWAAGYHTGTDFAAPVGTPVYAVYDGVIADLNAWGGAYGEHIILEVPGNKRYAYCHLSRITVSKGQRVRSGQVIGYTGNTGNTTGPHLHLELRKKPYRYDADDLNPIPTLMKKGVAPSGGGAPSSGKRGTKSAADLVYWAQTRAGGKYVLGAARTPSNPNQTVFDCSSLVQWAMYQIGIPNFPSSTFSQEPYLRKKGRQIPIDDAYKIRGALLYRAGGGRDHVAISLGNGKTIEASSPSIGITNLSVHGRDWTSAYLAPGVRY